MTGGSLQGAVADLGVMLTKAGVTDPQALATCVHASFVDNGYCIKDGLVRAAAPALGREGRAALCKLFEADLTELDTLPVATARSSREYDEASRRSAAAQGLMDLADAEGDVDAFLRAVERSPYLLGHADGAATRLLEAKRPTEALQWLDRVPPDSGQWRDPTGEGLAGLKLSALEALGRKGDAQTLRWQLFERYLRICYLRECVERLPDFEDDAVIRKAVAHALTFPAVLDALLFLVDWPDLGAAAQLVESRIREIDGRHYEVLNHAIDRLEAKYPVAATMLLRAKIDSVLTRAAATQYVHAARDLARAALLAARLSGEAALLSHSEYFAGLKAKHARKTSFWPKVKDAGQ